MILNYSVILTTTGITANDRATYFSLLLLLQSDYTIMFESYPFLSFSALSEFKTELKKVRIKKHNLKIKFLITSYADPFQINHGIANAVHLLYS